MRAIASTRLSPRVRGLLLALALLATLLAVYGVDHGASEPASAMVVDAKAQASGAGQLAQAGLRGEGRAGTAPSQIPVSVTSSDSPATRAPGAAGASAIGSDRLLRPRTMTSPAGDPFGAAPWTPGRISAKAEADRARREALTAPPPPPPPPPMAPPLPFTFFGRLIDGAQRQVFLNQGERTVIVGAGDAIDGTYRVDRIEENAVHFTYLPLGQQQTLTIPGAP